MEYILKTYDREIPVELPKGTKEIAGVVISGDEVIVYPVFCDPMGYYRDIDQLDGSFCKVYKDGEWVDKEDYVEIEIDLED